MLWYQLIIISIIIVIIFLVVVSTCCCCLVLALLLVIIGVIVVIVTALVFKDGAAHSCSLGSLAAARCLFCSLGDAPLRRGCFPRWLRRRCGRS
jgi:hypothetical protein